MPSDGPHSSRIDKTSKTDDFLPASTPSSKYHGRKSRSRQSPSASMAQGSFHYDIVWESASHLQIRMHLLIFVCLWVDVTLTAYYVNNLNGLRNMLS